MKTPNPRPSRARTASLTRTISTAFAALALAACAIEPAAPQTIENSLFSAAPSQQWRLPNRLREISGLAVTADGRVFAHDDEHAVIYEIDAVNGGLLKAFALGDPAEAGDFEGLAVTPAGDFWITDSEGRLLRFREGGDGEHVRFDRFDTGLSDICEVEGLAYLAAAESLILACKQNQARDMRDTISLYRWRLGAERAERFLALPEATLTSRAGVERFRPSSLDIEPATGRLVLLSAFDGAMAELSSDGEILSARRLRGEHVQAEAIAVLADGDALIADEGGRGRALLSRYARAP
jgi:uncharacterized protein YjiK